MHELNNSLCNWFPPLQMCILREFQGCVLNYNLSIFYFRLIKIIVGNMIRSTQMCFYVKTTGIHQSIWQTAAIGVGKLFPVAKTSLLFLTIKFLYDVWMRWFYAWNRMKVYMIIFYDHYSIVGLLWLLVEYFSDKKFSCHFPSFCMHFEVCQFPAGERITDFWDTQSS